MQAMRKQETPKPDYFVDFYELMQMSPNADPAAIHVMQYHLTEKYHPDNRETGDPQKHRAVLQAYKILGSAESRARYDVEYQRHKSASTPSAQQQPASGAMPQSDGGI